MKRLPSDPGKFEIIRIADSQAREFGFSLGDASHDDDILDVVRDQLRMARKCGILRHGLRVQAMFAYVAGAMGACTLVKEEDTGLILCAVEGIQPPDYRVITKAGTEMLVEVKNHRPSNPTKAFRLKASYVDSLQRYADLAGVDLKLAIHWSHWGLWTLLPTTAFAVADDSLSIALGNAVTRSEMAQVGDYEIGTQVPLVARFTSDPGKPRSIGPEGRAAFTIGSVDMYCADRKITDPVEKRIAWFLMLTSRWPISDVQPEIKDGKLISVGIECRPEQETPGQGFELMGSLSEMISRRYTLETAPDGEVARLLPSSQPSSLGVPIPQDYKGDALPLWRITVQPNYT